MRIQELTLTVGIAVVLLAGGTQHAKANTIGWEKLLVCGPGAVACVQSPPQTGTNGLQLADQGTISLTNCTNAELALGGTCSDSFSLHRSDFSIDGSFSALSLGDASNFGASLGATVTDNDGGNFRIVLLTGEQFSCPGCDVISGNASGTLSGGFNVAAPASDIELNSQYGWNFNYFFGPQYELSSNGNTFSSSFGGAIMYYPGFPVTFSSATNFDFGINGSTVNPGDQMDIPLSVQFTAQSSAPEPGTLGIGGALMAWVFFRRARREQAF